MQELFAKHRIPVIVSGAGILIAIGLAIAPNFKSTPEAEPKSSVAQAQDTPGTTIAPSGAGQSALLSQVTALEDLGRTHNKAIGRNLVRIGQIRAEVEILGDGVAETKDHETQIKTQNTAIGRNLVRIQKVRAEVESLGAKVAETKNHEIQIQTLNKAVSRINLRLVKLIDEIEAAR